MRWTGVSAGRRHRPGRRCARLVGLALDRLPDAAVLELLPAALRAGFALPWPARIAVALHRLSPRDAAMLALQGRRIPRSAGSRWRNCSRTRLSLRRRRIALQRRASPALDAKERWSNACAHRCCSR